MNDIINKTIKEKGNNADLNFIDTSLITDMSFLFSDFNDFNGDISKWDVSKVKDVNHMFSQSKFNGDISKWNVSKVEAMICMFCTNSFYEGASTGLHVNNVDFDIETVCSQHFLSSFSNGKTHEILNPLIRSNSGEKEYSDFLKLYTKIRKSNWFISSTLNKSLGVQYQSE